MRRRNWTLRLAVLVFLVAAPVAASATTVVPMADDDLALSVRVILEGSVQRLEPAWDPSRSAVVTYVSLNVDRTFKGPAMPATVVLRQIGGRTEHYATEIAGAPRFEAGQRVILFLNTDDDGALRVAHVSLGHYRVETDPASARPIVVRAAEATSLGTAASRRRVTDVGFKDEFLEFVEATLATRKGEADGYASRYENTPVLPIPPEYSPGLDRGGSASPAFTFLPPGFRWFESDSGRVIPVRLNSRTAPSATRGLDEAKSALLAWSSVSGSSFAATLTGPSTGGGRRPNGLNEIAFGDPLNEIDDPVNCTGVVATSGVTASSSVATVINGQRFVGITESDVVVNNGFDCILSDSVLLAEILTHEFGHAIGIGHSSERISESNEKLRDATMYFIAHNDGRRSSLRVDDSQAVRLLYPADANSKPLSLLSGSLPDALPGVAYAIDLKAEDGLTPRVWTLMSGSLPDGLRLTQDGRLGGTPTTNGTSVFSVLLKDASGAEIERTFSLRVTDQPSPFLLRASYKPGTMKLLVTGVHLDATAVIVINGTTLEGARVKYSERKGRLTIHRPASALDLRETGRNVIEVVVRGQRSNAVPF